MHLKVQGLVVRTTPYKDSDLLLTLLTADHGRITAKVRGAKKKNSRLIAACQLLTFCEFTLFEYHDMYTVNEAEILSQFSTLTQDLDKLALGTYFAQAAELVAQEDTETADVLRLVLNSLYALNRNLAPDVQIKAVFELRLACLAGYTPSIHGCVHCANPFPNRFNIVEGHLECSDCSDGRSYGIRIPVNSGMLDAMRYICSCPDDRLLSFRLSDENIDRLSSLTEGYLSTQLERGFTALDFYKSLNIRQWNKHN